MFSLFAVANKDQFRVGHFLINYLHCLKKVPDTFDRMQTADKKDSLFVSLHFLY